jgi:hypothetical protein
MLLTHRLVQMQPHPFLYLMLINKEKENCTWGKFRRTIKVSLLCYRPSLRADSPITAKQGFPRDAFVRRGHLSLVHFNVVIVHFDLVEIVLEGCLLCIHVLAAEVLHPCVVADELFLRAVSS